MCAVNVSFVILQCLGGAAAAAALRPLASKSSNEKEKPDLTKPELG